MHRASNIKYLTCPYSCFHYGCLMFLLRAGWVRLAAVSRCSAGADGSPVPPESVEW